MDSAGRASEIRRRLRTEIESVLTPGQRAERHALLELREQDSLTRTQKLENLREIRARVQDAVKEVLTAAQWELWLSLREDQKDTIRDQVGA